MWEGAQKRLSLTLATSYIVGNKTVTWEIRTRLLQCIFFKLVFGCPKFFSLKEWNVATGSFLSMSRESIALAAQLFTNCLPKKLTSSFLVATICRTVTFVRELKRERRGFFLQKNT
jgi:hypothetical protein